MPAMAAGSSAGRGGGAASTTLAAEQTDEVRSIGGDVAHRAWSLAVLLFLGGLGIAVAFQQRARMVLDARSTGTGPGEPWRILLLPQAEGICLVVRIDGLGVHEIGLYKLDDGLGLLADWLPRGQWADPKPQADVGGVLGAAERSAPVTVTGYTAQGSAEVAGRSTDLILARQDGRLHVFSRDPGEPAKLVPRPTDGKDARDTLAELLMQPVQ
jgi:hypothetical protein